MSISFNEHDKTLTLETDNSSYQMRVDEYGYLHHQYYGRKVYDDNMEYIISAYDRGFSGNPYEFRNQREFSLDTLPQEYTGYGIGDFRIHSIAVANGDGSFGVDFRYVSHEIKKGKYAIKGMPAVYDNGGEADTLIVTMQDPVTLLKIELYYGVFEKNDVITRTVKVINEGNSTVRLNQVASACLDMPFGKWDMIHFHGRYSVERKMERSPLIHSIQTIASKRGISSHHHNPFVILCDPEANENYGDCYGFMFMYSGNHKIEIELDQLENVRLVMGIHDSQFSWDLKPQEEFYAPEVILSFSKKGLTHLSHNYHRIIRNNVCRGKYKNKRCPVLINNWEATYFDFDEEKILGIAKQASELGVEMMVLDDGWFGTRDSDNSGLGDWFINKKKFPKGLKHLISRINNLGMKFGIWIEPEMVNEDSELYRKHPEWAFTQPGRKPMMSRNQMVLDMSREDVRDYLYDCFATLFRENNIEYVKWDMNRALADVYSNELPPERQGEVSHRYVLGIYDLMDRLTREFPDILFEGCAGGGGRFDAGILYYAPQIWCSDDTDPIERLKIQYGTSFGYPSCVVGAHVSASPNEQTGRTTPLNTRGILAMSGTFGYELDPGKMTEEEKKEIKEQIETFKKYHELIQTGVYYRLSNPFKTPSYTAWQFVSEDKSESLVNFVVASPKPNGRPVRLRFKGLEKQGIYVIEGEEDKTYSGSALMYGGYTFPLLTGDYPGMQLHLIRVK